jgi:AraC-like DNA-binding protein
MNTFFEKLFFSVFLISTIAFFDVLIKFKRPLVLKFLFLLISSIIGFTSLIHSLDLTSTNYIFYIIFSKALIASAFLNVFSNLYFLKYRIWVVLLSISLITFTVASFYYSSLINPEYIESLRSQTLVIVKSSGLELPLFMLIIRSVLILSFFGTFVFFLYKIINKFGLNNIYFDKIKVWTIAIFLIMICMLLLYIPFPFLKNNDIVGFSISFVIYLTVVLTILYRPNFLNKSSLKISFGDSFSRNVDLNINDLDFINNFFTNFYFTNPEASLENFSKVLNVGSNDLYKFVYYKYNMTFSDLVNKQRVEYFVDIIHNPKFANFTIDALAKEVGFSSRQHLYKPFKKFHGGNPSDLIDAVLT